VVTYGYRFEGFGDDGISSAKGSRYFSGFQLNMEGNVGGVNVLSGGWVNDLDMVEILSEGIVQVPTFSGVCAGALLELVGGVGLAPTVVTIVFLLFLIIGPGGAWVLLEGGLLSWRTIVVV
jgi:hypothetical protein